MGLKELIKESYFYTNKGMLFKGDTLEWMSKIPDEKIDLILADLPFNVTQNSWDLAIPKDPLWEQYLRIIKPNGAILLFGQDKFTAAMMLSQPKIHRYNIIWDKVMTTGFLNANRMPLRSHEDIMVFYKKLPTYNPQKTLGEKSHSKGNKKRSVGGSNYGEAHLVDNSEEHGDLKFPTSILRIDKVHPSKALHPTEKPVPLLSWLIKTYSNENEIVLDNTSGVGSTAVAAEIENRKWICIEKDEDENGNSLGYCDKTVVRLKEIKNNIIHNDIQ